MIIKYEAILPEAENTLFLLALADALSPIAEVSPEFFPVAQTIGQLEIIVQLAEGEITKGDVLDAIRPIIDAFTPASMEAKCRVQNCGSTPISTWCRYAL